MRRLLQLDIFQWFAMLIGLTSYRLVDNRFIQTRIARTYAMIVNVFTVTMLPLPLSRLAYSVSLCFWLPRFMWITPYVLYAVNYAVILEDQQLEELIPTRAPLTPGALKEVQPLLTKLLREEKRNGKQRLKRSLLLPFYLKFFTAAFMCLTICVFQFHSGAELTWKTTAQIIFLSNVLNILEVVPMGYFLALWHIARGFDFVNQRLDDIMASTPIDLKELRNLWSLHAAMTRTVLRINKIYGVQMLAFRFDNFIFGVINAYWGTFFSFHADTNVLWVVFGAVSYWIRCVDSYLIDHVSDLAMHYQSSPKHAWTEKYWSKEINSYVTYVSSCKLQLRTCGLYQENRSLWFETISSILYYYIMLLQFHLVIRN
ncbi:putative gustatory receptor 59b [Drosophila obscura]|uniref:putative gustatory receptor 59b n=1 Tax=Drosophila obscura TaxID=7282 RepID=UPI001BB15E48|nr:putative gustatory receptor 59b [Drosophila obscura]